MVVENDGLHSETNFKIAIKDFAERTTFHGIRYITEETRYKSRRLVLLLACYLNIRID